MEMIYGAQAWLFFLLNKIVTCRSIQVQDVCKQKKSDQAVQYACAA